MGTCEIHTTAKLRLNPDARTAILLEQAANAFINGCNHVASYAVQHGSFSLKELHGGTYRTLRNEHGLPSQMACTCIRKTIATFDAIRTSGKDEAGKSPKFRKPFALFVKNHNYSINSDNSVSIRLLNERVKIPFVSKGFDIKDRFALGGATLVIRKHKFFLHVEKSAETGIPDLREHGCVVGVDRGINKIIAASSDIGDFIVDGRRLKHKRGQIKALRERLQRLGTPASRRKLKLIGSRENGCVADVNHRVSKALVGRYPKNSLFVFEDLSGIRGSLERVRTRDRYLSVSWAYADLLQKVEYKARLAGSETVCVDPAYTSQRCPICGHIGKGNRNKETHSFMCKKCGYRSNDDRIGGMNLKVKGDFLKVIAKRLGIDDFRAFPEEIPEDVMNDAMSGFPAMWADVNQPERKTSRFFSIRRQHEDDHAKKEGGKNPVRTSGQSQASAFRPR